MDWNCLDSILDKCSKIDGKGIHFVNRDGSTSFVSFFDFRHRVNRYAQILKKVIKNKAGTLILFMPHKIEFLVAFWACQILGITAVPLTLSLLNDSLKKLSIVYKKLNNSNVLIYDKNILNRIESFVDISDIICFEETCDVVIDNKNINKKNEDDIALIQFSSGSTCSPKGVLLSHKNLLTNVSDISERLEITDNDSICSWMPFTHDMGLICFHLTAMYNGISQFYIEPGLFIRNPLILLQTIDNYRISITGTPTFGLNVINKVLKHTNFSGDLSCLKSIKLGAENISFNACSEFYNNLAECGLHMSMFRPGYGLAEASVAVSFGKANAKIETVRIAKESILIGKKVTYSDSDYCEYVKVGKVLKSCDIRITDADGNILPVEHIGRIEISGTNVSMGYLGQKMNNKWIYTGDIGFICKSGEIVVLDREKNILIQKGINYSAIDIENIVEENFEYYKRNVVAFSLLSSIDGVEKFYLAVKSKEKKISDEFHRKVRSVIQRQIGCSIDFIIGVPYIPRTTSGKKQHYVVKGWMLNEEYNTVAK